MEVSLARVKPNHNISTWVVITFRVCVDRKLWRRLDVTAHLPPGWRARRATQYVRIRCQNLAAMSLLTPDKADNFYATLVLIQQKES